MTTVDPEGARTCCLSAQLIGGAVASAPLKIGQSRPPLHHRVTAGSEIDVSKRRPNVTPLADDDDEELHPPTADPLPRISNFKRGHSPPPANHRRRHRDRPAKPQPGDWMNGVSAQDRRIALQMLVTEACRYHRERAEKAAGGSGIALAPAVVRVIRRDINVLIEETTDRNANGNYQHTKEELAKLKLW